MESTAVRIWLLLASEQSRYVFVWRAAVVCIAVMAMLCGLYNLGELAGLMVSPAGLRISASFLSLVRKGPEVPTYARTSRYGTLDERLGHAVGCRRSTKVARLHSAQRRYHSSMQKKKTWTLNHP